MAICYEFPPQVVAGAIWTGKLLQAVQAQGWQIDVLSGFPQPEMPQASSLHYVPHRWPHQVAGFLQRWKLDKLTDFFIWPDPSQFWIRSATRRAMQIIEETKPDLILNFMLPYAAGQVGLALQQQTGLPLVYCFSDAQSCTDMHPFFPTVFHYHHARRLEDAYVRAADRVVYVSQFNADLVRSRQAPVHQGKFRVVRLGAEPAEFAPRGEPAADPTRFRIIYTGTFSGWHDWHQTRPWLSRCKRWWDELGRYKVAQLDYRTHSPIYIGHAMQQVLARHPEWQGRLHLDIYGPQTCSLDYARKVLASQKLDHLITVHGKVSRDEITYHTRQADLLFHGVQARVDGSPGGRIASKTYEYLMTDRPILAAVPLGENWNYYLHQPGVFLVHPHDTSAMTTALEQVASSWFSGTPLRFDRSTLLPELNYAHRGQQLSDILQEVLDDKNK